MKALLRKELGPFLLPALVGAMLFAGAYALVFDVDTALLAPSAGALSIVLLGALCMGALLGYGQLSIERHGDTLSYLLHRPQPPGCVLAAKVISGWTLLGVVVHLPLLAFALWERWTSPLGPVLQWARLGEMQVIALACLPAHALGLLCATLRCAPGLRTALLLLFVGGLGLAIAVFMQNPVAWPSASRGIYAGGLALLALLLLLCVRRELVRLDDAERAPPLARLLSLGGLSLVLIGLPAVGCITALQGSAARAFSSREPDLLWREDTGFVLATREGASLETATRLDGSPIDLFELVESYEKHWLSVSDVDSAGFKTVWSAQTLFAPGVLSEARGLVRAPPAIAPPWLEIANVCFRRPGSDVVTGGAKAFLDRARGRVLALHAPRWPRSAEGRQVTEFVDAPVPTLRALRRGDGRPFGLRAGGGVGFTFEYADLLVVNDEDGTRWTLALGDPQSEFQRAGSVEAPHVRRAQPSPFRRETEGDRLAYTVRVLDRESGEPVLELRQGPLAASRVHAAALLLLASDLLHAPLAMIGAHFAAKDSSWEESDPLAGALTSGGRRPQLAAAVLCLACALAWVAQRRLARRGAHPLRRWGWAVLIALLGLQAWLLFLALEPRAPRPAPTTVERRGPLLASSEATPA